MFLWIMESSNFIFNKKIYAVKVICAHYVKCGKYIEVELRKKMLPVESSSKEWLQVRRLSSSVILNKCPYFFSLYCVIAAANNTVYITGFIYKV